MQTLINQLNATDIKDRLNALKTLADKVKSGEITLPNQGSDVNNHIHTIYSFSPYSPSSAVWHAYMAGLTTAGIMDHDSISGAEEFIKAGEIIGLATTIGIECRCNMAGTALDGFRINNPDQNGVAYVALHGVPHTQIPTVTEFFAPYRAERNKRNRKMTDRLNEILTPYGISLDFDKDIAPLSMSHQGGSITERHILFAVSKKITARFGRGNDTVAFLKNELKINLSLKIEALLTDSANPHYEYDLLGALKSDMVAMFYIAATTECPPVADVVALAQKTGAILAYAYLGDITNSVTGDKKAQTFEDGYLDLLIETITGLGFNSVTYMPSRNTLEQLQRVKALCDKAGLFQISGEDINTPRQSFVCEAQRNDEFKNLIDATWALIGHEKAATKAAENAFFSKETIAKYPQLKERIAVYKNIGTNE